MRVITDTTEWKKAISEAVTYDFYHTADYHALHQEGDAKLFVFEYKNEKVLLPLLLRPIEGTPYFDLTSAYGYVGCLYNTDYPSTDILNIFRDEMTEYALDNNIISAFSRLHPLIQNSDNFPDKLGEVINLNRTVSIITSDSNENQVLHFSPVLRRQLKNIEHNGVTIREAKSTDEWANFSNLYNEAMLIKHAPLNYHYSTSYFLDFKNSHDFSPHLFLAEYDNKVIAGSIFVVCSSIMQYHLGAVIEEFRPLSPLKKLINHARHIATEKGIKKLHLGGGYNGAEDGLFQFKSRFSHEFSSFSVWRWIVNKNIYNHLSEGLSSDRFPNYRNIK